MIMPPRNAPRVRDSPTSPVAQPAASATSRALAVNTSSLRLRAIRSNTGRTTRRAASTATPNAAAAFSSAAPNAGSRGRASPQRTGHDQQEDGGHVLKDEDRGRRKADWTVLLVPFRDQPGDHRGGRQRQRGADHKGGQRRQPEQGCRQAQPDRAQQHLHPRRSQKCPLPARVCDARKSAGRCRTAGTPRPARPGSRRCRCPAPASGLTRSTRCPAPGIPRWG